MLYLTRQQVRDVDRHAIEQLGIPGIVLMENAAAGAARVAMGMLRGRAERALILCGGGNNGGDGLAIARHLHLRGLEVSIAYTVDPASYKGDAAINAQIVQRMKLSQSAASPQQIAAWSGGLIVDAIFGTGLTQPPRGNFWEIVDAVAQARSRSPILAVDLPSGLDCDTGRPLGDAAICADVTVTFVARKQGFANPDSRKFTGKVVVASIGAPVPQQQRTP